MEWLQTEFGSVIGFIFFLQLLRTTNSSAIAISQTLHLVFSVIYVFISPIVTGSNGGRSHSSEFPNWFYDSHTAIFG
jgi:hypothetical protein